MTRWCISPAFARLRLRDVVRVALWVIRGRMTGGDRG
jgi:hypothetical protein